MTGLMMKYKKISDYLDEIIPNPHCELNYSSDYTLLISIVLSAQTTDRRVNQVTAILYSKYPSIEALSNANLDDIKKIIRPIGNFNKKANFVKAIATKLHTEYHDQVPLDENSLISFPGVGHKTVNVFLSEYKNIPRIAVDTHVLRVSKRLGLAKEKADPLEVEKALCKAFPQDKWSKIHLQLVLFGRYYCKALKPDCCNCQLQEFCKYYNK